ncbi:MAG: asparagine synthase (glutamine-hydrolyzing), partial [Gemmataceae bacterium]
MTNSIAHRGPDAEGFYHDENIALGHRRLSIIDLSAAANQPMHDASGRYVITYNGEIYNYKEVRSALPDYPFRTQSDSEVVLAAYLQWGENCLERLNGMFAFAIWDRTTGSLFIARDRLGVKPLYYYHNRANGKEDIFMFASEIRALLASGIIPKKLNFSALSNYLQYQTVFGHSNIIEGVMTLPAGHFGTYSNGILAIKAYWQIGAAQDNRDKNDPATVHQEIRHLMQVAIARRMVSDVPVSAFLSGGIDSSAVVGLMAEQSAQPINTFSITFEEPEYDESIYSSLIAKRFNTRHTPFNLRASDFLDHFHEALAAMDNPSGDGFNTYLVSKITRNTGIKVALSGIGGDELFAGYAGFKRWIWLQKHWLWRIPASVRGLGSSVLNLSQNATYQRIADILSIEKANIESIYPSF